MDFRDFLGVAESLSVADTEADWRSACSRAYYAAFHVAGQFLRGLGFQVPAMERAHAYAWLRLSNSQVLEINDMGRLLNNLRSDRNRADYDGHLVYRQEKAIDTVQAAYRIVATLDGVSDASIRIKITNAIKTYERDVLKENTWQAS